MKEESSRMSSEFLREAIRKLETRQDLERLIGLPLEIYGTLSYVGLTADGELALYISKDNKYKLVELVQKLKIMTGREVYVYVDLGDWEGRTR